jgi:formylmethanofuran dehydrogenase subunit E
MVDINCNLERDSSPVERIGTYTWEEFLERVNSFHHFASPGVIIGGVMVSIAMEEIPEGVLYNVICETPACVPDAVQLLTPCTIGNNWLRIINLGRFAVSLYNKYDGNGVRVYLDPKKLEKWDEIKAWILKLKPKQDQDDELLREEIRRAGHDIYALHPVKIKPDYLKKHSKGSIGICNMCGEAYPLTNGAVCLGCQGEAPYENTTSSVIV